MKRKLKYFWSSLIVILRWHLAGAQNGNNYFSGPRNLLTGFFDGLQQAGDMPISTLLWGNKVQRQAPPPYPFDPYIATNQYQFPQQHSSLPQQISQIFHQLTNPAPAGQDFSNFPVLTGSAQQRQLANVQQLASNYGGLFPSPINAVQSRSSLPELLELPQPAPIAQRSSDPITALANSPLVSYLLQGISRPAPQQQLFAPVVAPFTTPNVPPVQPRLIQYGSAVAQDMDIFRNPSSQTDSLSDSRAASQSSTSSRRHRPTAAIETRRKPRVLGFGDAVATDLELFKKETQRRRKYAGVTNEFSLDNNNNNNVIDHTGVLHGPLSGMYRPHHNQQQQYNNPQQRITEHLQQQILNNPSYRQPALTFGQPELSDSQGQHYEPYPTQTNHQQPSLVDYYDPGTGAGQPQQNGGPPATFGSSNHFGGSPFQQEFVRPPPVSFANSGLLLPTPGAVPFNNDGKLSFSFIAPTTQNPVISSSTQHEQQSNTSSLQLPAIETEPTNTPFVDDNGGTTNFGETDDLAVIKSTENESTLGDYYDIAGNLSMADYFAGSSRFEVDEKMMEKELEQLQQQSSATTEEQPPPTQLPNPFFYQQNLFNAQSQTIQIPTSAQPTVQENPPSSIPTNFHELPQRLLTPEQTANLIAQLPFHQIPYAAQSASEFGVNLPVVQPSYNAQGGVSTNQTVGLTAAQVAQLLHRNQRAQQYQQGFGLFGLRTASSLNPNIRNGALFNPVAFPPQHQTVTFQQPTAFGFPGFQNNFGRTPQNFATHFRGGNVQKVGIPNPFWSDGNVNQPQPPPSPQSTAVAPTKRTTESLEPSMPERLRGFPTPETASSGNEPEKVGDVPQTSQQTSGWKMTRQEESEVEEAPVPTTTSSTTTLSFASTGRTKIGSTNRSAPTTQTTIDNSVTSGTSTNTTAQPQQRSS